MEAAPPRSRTLNVITAVTLLFTVALIFVGGLVTSKGAGLSVPDWPNSYGYNMFLFPPSKWVGGIFYEHGHRLMGTLVGFGAAMMVVFAYGPSCNPSARVKWIIATIVLAGLTSATLGTTLILRGNERAEPIRHLASHFFTGFAGLMLVCGACVFARSREPRRWVRRATIGALLLTIFQGILGGVRVDYVWLDIAIVHACVAQAFLCFVAFVWFATSGVWKSPSGVEGRTIRVLLPLAVGLFFIIYGQLIVAAIMRHYQAGLAIPDLPLAYGHVLPPTNATELAAANTQRLADYRLMPVTLAQIWLHFGHRLGAIVVTTAAAIVVAFVLIRARRDRALFVLALLLTLGVLTQVTLGVATVYLRKPADVASTHVATGALVLMTSALIVYRTARARTMSFDA